MDEFQRINQILAPLSQGYDGGFNLSDDVAQLNFIGDGLCQLVNVDALVEGVHFLPNSDPYLLAQKLLNVNLSDLAAKGAWPQCYFLTLGLPPTLDHNWLTKFALGLGEVQRNYGFYLIGGDCVATYRDIHLSVTMIGTAKHQGWHRRASAKEGDLLYATGPIGDGYLGLKCARHDEVSSLLQSSHKDYLLKRYLCPTARIELGQSLNEISNHCCFNVAAIDISDGLLADCGHLLKASNDVFKLSNPNHHGLGAVIYADKIPLSDAACQWLAEDVDCFPDLLSGGDDYEILFTAPPYASDHIASLLKQYPTICNIGKIIYRDANHQDYVQLIGRDGNAMPLPNKGYRHFV